MRLVLSCLLLGLGVVPLSMAAPLDVLIKEKGSGVLIEGATVVLDAGEQYGQSSTQGQIRFEEREGAKKVKVLASGYETLSETLKPQQSKITLYLRPLLVESDGLQVSAARLVEKGSKLTLSKAELLQTAGSGGDPLKAITALPGIVAANEGSAEVYMRGSNGRDNITWVNHTPVGYLYHFGGFQSTINPALIEDINVFLGGFPVQYGDALGGVVDARLRAPKTDRLHMQFDVSTVSSSFLFEGPVGDQGDGFFVAGRRSYLDLLLSPSAASDLFSDPGEQDPNQVLLVPRFYDLQGLYRHQLKGGYVESYLFAAGDEVALELRGTVRSDPQLAGELHSKVEYQSVGLTWQQRWNAESDSVINLAYLHNKSSVRVGRDENGASFYADVEQKTLHLQPEWRRTLSEGALLTVGVDLNSVLVPLDLYVPRRQTENDVNVDFTSQTKFRVKRELKAQSSDPYVKYRHRWGDNLTTQLELRSSNVSISGGFEAHQISPRLGLEYQLNSDTLLTANWGRYLQQPNGADILEGVGNPALLMQEAEHRILGVERQLSSLYSLKAEVYHKPMKNLVIALDENAPPNNFANKGTGEAVGFDLFLKRKTSQGKRGWLSLSWAKSERTNEVTGITRDFSGDQPLTLIVVWGQPFTGRWSRWDWSAKAEVHSGRPYTAVIARHQEDPTDINSRWLPEFGQHNVERLPLYRRIDLRLSRDFLFNESKMKFYLDLQNVTFANNIVEYDYGSEYEKIDNPTEISGLSFFPYMGVEMEF
ncbi:MAG: TonB-dependent receptor [Gammaproteobacteria bacterium]|nr:TonB-dependent receptor [Gammaproteobacteria bacterium]